VACARLCFAFFPWLSPLGSLLPSVHRWLRIHYLEQSHLYISDAPIPLLAANAQKLTARTTHDSALAVRWSVGLCGVPAPVYFSPEKVGTGMGSAGNSAWISTGDLCKRSVMNEDNYGYLQDAVARSQQRFRPSVQRRKSSLQGKQTPSGLFGCLGGAALTTNARGCPTLLPRLRNAVAEQVAGNRLSRDRGRRNPRPGCSMA
jgi:hypothetical protein